METLTYLLLPSFHYYTIILKIQITHINNALYTYFFRLCSYHDNIVVSRDKIPAANNRVKSAQKEKSRRRRHHLT